MKITVTCIRVKRKDSIQEIFTWSPNSRYIFDSQRQITKRIKLLIAQMSLHNKVEGIKLLDINYFDNSIVFMYNIIDGITISTMESQEINYFPTLKNKTCKNCEHLKVWNNQFICLLRVLPADKFKGCWEWEESGTTENPRELRKKDVHKQKTTRRNSRTNREF